MIGIYKITSPSGKIYIGQSVNIFRRFSDYKKLRCKDQPSLYNSFLKYGAENHKFDIIENCLVEELNERERFYQEYYDVIVSGLNCKMVGYGDKSGFCSNQTKLKISNSNKGKAPMKGRKHSQETIQKMKNNHARPMLGKFGELNPNFGKRISEAQRKKLSEIASKRTGNNNPFFGKTHNKETRDKIAKSRLGKQNMSKEKYKEAAYKRRKLILDKSTGVFFIGLDDACFSYGLKKENLRKWLTGVYSNKTNLIYV